jgi:hypothetical protein
MVAIAHSIGNIEPLSVDTLRRLDPQVNKVAWEEGPHNLVDVAVIVQF